MADRPAARGHALMMAANHWLLTTPGRRGTEGERLRAAVEELRGAGELPPALRLLRDRAAEAQGGGLAGEAALRAALLGYCAAARAEGARERGTRFVPAPSCAASHAARSAEALTDEWEAP